MIFKSRKNLVVGALIISALFSLFNFTLAEAANDPRYSSLGSLKAEGWGQWLVDLSRGAAYTLVQDKQTGQYFINYSFTTGDSDLSLGVENTGSYPIDEQMAQELLKQIQNGETPKVNLEQLKQSGFLAEANSGSGVSVSSGSVAKEPIKTSSGGLWDILGLAISMFLYWIAYGLGMILMLVVKVMLMVATFNDFVNNETVSLGWTITRDVCNNFFIILMIVMAIGTTLRVQNYQWRAMLPKVLIAAVLINFSKMFTGIMIDASQVIMLTFATPLASSTGYNIILAGFGLPDATNLSNFATSRLDGGKPDQVNLGGLEWGDIMAALLFAIIATIAAMVVMVAITGILVYRIIMFWFLIILSPLWIFGLAFNKLSQLTSQWQGEIMQYLIVGPMMMFFVYLSFMTIQKNGERMNSGTGGNILSVKDAGNAADTTGGYQIGNANALSLSKMASVDGLINFLVIIGLLWGSLMMGQRFGGMGKGIAGKAQGWMKKYTGANLAQSALKKAPGAIGTYVDDKLGVRSKLYSGLYQAGGKYVPGLNTAIGGKIGALESGTTKREQAKIDAAAVAMKMNRMDTKQLRAAANSLGASTAQKMAATQTLMKNGWLKDDDETNRDNNLDLLNFYRSQLPGELRNTFDSNIKKSNPNLALQSNIYGGSKGLDRLTQDIGDGRIKLADLMKNADAETLRIIKNGGDSDALMAYLIKNSKDDKEFGTIMAGLSKTAKDTLSDATSGITSQHFVSTLSDPAEQDKEQRKLDKMREAYIKSAKDFRFDQIFDISEDEKRDNFASANQSFITAEAGVKQLEGIMNNVGHVFNPNALEQIQKRGSEFEKALKGVFEGIATSLRDADLNSSDKDVKKKAIKLMENAMIAGSEVKVDSDIRQGAMAEILAGKNKSKVLDNLAEENVTAGFLQSAVKAGLSDADYGKLNRQKVKDGFKTLTSGVDATTNASEAARIYEQALISGAQVEISNNDSQKAALQAALRGRRKREIMGRISHENITSEFVDASAGVLNGKDFQDIARISPEHQTSLQSELGSKYLDLVSHGIMTGQERNVEDLMSHMSAVGSYIDFGASGTPYHAQRQSLFANVSRRMTADSMKSINLRASAGGAISNDHVETLALNMPLKVLRSFLQNPSENTDVAVAISAKIKGWASSGVREQKARYDKLKDIL